MNFAKKIFKLGLIFLLIVLCLHICLYIYCLITPKIKIPRNQSFYLYDNNNQLVFNNYSWISLDKINQNVIDATLSVEDKHFFHHIGFDYLRIFKAILKNISSKSLSEGASTITQQFARNLYLNHNKTWKRKIDEAILAFELETHYTKKEILEGYLNTINYGGIFGIENAAKYYFNKSAKNLSLAEASMLAGIPQSPMNNSPIFNEKVAIKRQRTVLNSMLNNKKITTKDFNAAVNEKLNYIGNNNINVSSGLFYFKDAVMDELNSIKNLPSSILSTGGIKIYTTLDAKAQSELERIVNEQKMDDLQAAAILMNPKNGNILAMIGGVNYNSSQYNRATKAKRQVGSTMKPFLYYEALENGFTAASSFISEKTVFTLSNNNIYTPKNYNNKYANGPLSMGAAIAYSDNIYAVKTHLFLGEDKLVTISNRLGIHNQLDPVPSLALGTSEISLIEMVTAYASFANMGEKVNGHFIEKIEDFNGNILYEYKEEKRNILNKSLVFILNEMLTYTYDKSFINYNYPTMISLAPRMTKKYAIKSGTTNTDNWIIGYNKDAVLGVWTGYDDNKFIDNNTSKIHKEIWINLMENYLKNKKSTWYDVPNNIIGVLVDPISGDVLNCNNNNGKIFYFLRGTEPNFNKEKYNLDAVFYENKDINKKK